MYNKEIYDDWKLHVDATQLEISFKFVEKSIKILSTTKLSDENKNNIEDQTTLERWKKVILNDLINQYNTISKDLFNLKNENDFFYEIIIYLADQIHQLRKNNHKFNDLEQNIGPKFFLIVTNTLDVKKIEDVYNVLLHDILSNEKFELDENINVSLKIEDSTNIRNTVWNLENLCLTFKDLHKWFSKLSIQKQENNKYLLNLMLVYYISNFYLKYINDLNGNIISYNRIYSATIAFIKNIINEHRPFVLITFKSIAIFLNLLIQKYNFERNDTIISNYLLIIKICCNEINTEKLKSIVFSELSAS